MVVAKFSPKVLASTVIVYAPLGIGISKFPSPSVTAIK